MLPAQGGGAAAGDGAGGGGDGAEEDQLLAELEQLAAEQGAARAGGVGALTRTERAVAEVAGAHVLTDADMRAMLAAADVDVDADVGLHARLRVISASRRAGTARAPSDAPVTARSWLDM